MQDCGSHQLHLSAGLWQSSGEVPETDVSVWYGSGVRVTTRPVSTGAVILKFFCYPTNFVAYCKYKNLPPGKMYFTPQTLKPGYWPGYNRGKRESSATEIEYG